MKKGKSTALFTLCIVLIAAFAYIGYYGVEIFGYKLLPFSKVINKGLDLQGGISVVEEIQAKKVTPEDMSREIEFINMRINKLGVAETEVRQEGQKRIKIDVPGIFDSKSVMNMIGKTGELKFIGPDKKVILTGKDVKNAVAVPNEKNEPEIRLEFTTEGTKKFAEATKKFMRQQISIYMDEDMLTSPVVNSVITDGSAVITGSKDLQSAKITADMIKSGALPLPIKPVSFKTVGATLGSSVIPNTKKAAVIGVALVLLLMLVLYRLPGLIADIALVLFILLDLLAFSLAGGTLTLSGIAGFLLTVGMAVDANVLIFERTKEELRTGKTLKSAINSGFDKALSSILDSNITTIIAGLILYMVGSGAVKGFALTLMMGVVISIFTALTVTRFLIKLTVDMGLINKPSHFGIKEKKKGSIKIVERTKIWFSVSAIVIIIGIGCTIFKGLNYGIDFTGGTLLNINMNKTITLEDKKETSKIINEYTKKYSLRDINDKKEFEIIIQSGAVKSGEISEIKNKIKDKFKLGDNYLLSEESIEGSVGKELTKKAWESMICAGIAMLIYIGFRFQLNFGIAAILALLHDILITLSIYAILGVKVNSPFIAAILTILGYSINDTIVVFDRIRENRRRLGKVSLDELINTSVNQTISRSINTSISTLITILALLIMVPSIRELTLPLTIGILAGTYSSIFIASPMWVILQKRKFKTSK